MNNLSYPGTSIDNSSAALSAAENAGFCPYRLGRIAPAIKPFIDNKKIPGALTVIARQGKLVHLQCHGYADKEAGKAVQADTLFRIYSMTKPVTAVAVMMLYEQGLFSLEDPIADYLPAFANMKVMTDTGLVDAAAPITIRQLLTHSSGLSYSMIPDNPAVSALYEQHNVNEVYGRLTMTLAEHTELLAQQPLIAHPGTAWRYSESIGVLARLVEVLSRKNYSAFLQQNIFAPLAMVDTAYQTHHSNSDRLAVLYEQTPSLDNFVPSDKYGGDYTQPAQLEAGGAGLLSTASDYLKFAQMLLNEGELNGVRLLSPLTTRLMMSDQFEGQFARYLPELSVVPMKGMGHGFAGAVVTDKKARGVLGSNGEYSWGGWASTHFWVDPEEQLIGMVFTQLIPQREQLLGLSERFRQMVYQAMTTSLIER